jgi:type II secretory pathway pseudopilin PulG
MITRTATTRKELLVFLVLFSLLFLSAACSLSGQVGNADSETIAALSTENTALSTQVAVQDALLATQAAANGPSPESQPNNEEEPSTGLEITGSYPSPDGSAAATIYEDSILAIEDSSGETLILHSSISITGLSWFPNGSALALSDRVEDADSPLKVRDRLLMADIATGEITVLADGFAPAVSPDGQWIAFYEGIHYGDACSVGWRLAFLRLDSSGNIKQTLHQEDFAGLPESSDEGTFYPSPNDTPSNPGVWEGALQFESFLRYGCVVDPAEDGVYLFNLETLTAEKVGAS